MKFMRNTRVRHINACMHHVILHMVCHTYVKLMEGKNMFNIRETYVKRVLIRMYMHVKHTGCFYTFRIHEDTCIC